MQDTNIVDANSAQNTDTAQASPTPINLAGSDPSSFGTKLVAAFGSDPVKIADYLNHQGGSKTDFFSYGDSVYYTTPDIAANLTKDNVADFVKNNMVQKWTPGFVASTTANGPEIGLSALGAMTLGGLAAPTGPGAVAAGMGGAALGGAAGDAIKQGIGALLGIDRDRSLESRGIEAGTAGVLNGALQGTGELAAPYIKSFLGLPATRALLPSEIGSSIGNKLAGSVGGKAGEGAGDFFEWLNNRLGTSYPNAIKSSNDNLVTDMVKNLTGPDTGSIVDTNKSLAKSIPAAFQAQKDQAGALYDSVKAATSNKPANIKGLIQDVKDLIGNSSNDDFQEIANGFIDQVKGMDDNNISDLIDLKQNLNSNQFFKSNNNIVNRNLQQLKNLLDDSISEGIKNKTVLDNWNQANDIYSKAIRTYQPLMSKLGKGASNNGVQTFEKVIMPPSSKFAPNLSLGQVPQDLQDLVDQSALKRITLNAIDPVSGQVNYKQLSKVISSPEQLESLRQVINPTNAKLSTLDAIREIMSNPDLFNPSPAKTFPLDLTKPATWLNMAPWAAKLANVAVPATALAYQPFTTVPKMAGVDALQPSMVQYLQQALSNQNPQGN